jgi:hypothetical protein
LSELSEGERDTVQRYKRELERLGLDPKTVGAELMGATLERFWVVLYAGPGDEWRPEELASDLEKNFGVSRPFTITQVTVVFRSGVWRGEAAIPVSTIDEMVRFVYALDAKLSPSLVWDRLLKREFRTRSYESVNYEDFQSVELGWRSPRHTSRARAAVLREHVRAISSSCLSITPHSPHGNCPGLGAIALS